MSRSSWKPLFLSNEFSLQLKDKKKLTEPIFCYNRSTVLTKPMLGLTINVYNGLRFFSIIVSLDMLGHRLGEFSPTRKKPIAKKDKQIKK